MLRSIFCININTQVTGNQKLFKIDLKKLFFENVLVFIDIF